MDHLTLFTAYEARSRKTVKDCDGVSPKVAHNDENEAVVVVVLVVVVVVVVFLLVPTRTRTRTASSSEGSCILIQLQYFLTSAARMTRMRRLKSKYFLALSCFTIPKSKKDRIRAAEYSTFLQLLKVPTRDKLVTSRTRTKPVFLASETGIYDVFPSRIDFCSKLMPSFTLGRQFSVEVFNFCRLLRGLFKGHCCVSRVCQ